VHNGDEQLLSDIRALWKQSLILNRPGRPRDQIGADMASGLADLEAYGQMVLANPDFVARLKTAAPMNEAIALASLAAPRRAIPTIPRMRWPPAA